MNFDQAHFTWALQSLCAIHRRPFSPDLLHQQCPPPLDAPTLVRAARALGFKSQLTVIDAKRLADYPLPLLVATRQTEAVGLGILVAVSDTHAIWLPALQNDPVTLPLAELNALLAGPCFPASPEVAEPTDPDAPLATGSAFGFRWFVPELLKHRSVWRDVLGASLILQLLALGMPLFTQAIIDKVIVNRTESTLMALALGMGMFALFTALLTWFRQFAVLHTGNRVDAVLGAKVFKHLFSLPPRYFEHRPTGVIAARLQGVETIREFVASSAVTLILDLPFLLVCLGVMLYYSVPLTLLVVVVLVVIALLSFLVAPVFQSRLNEQFLLGARNQAFMTEYVAGLETVKSLQLEPQLQTKYDGYLASFLQSGFRTKQMANTYNVVANTLEQAMTMGVLLMGAWVVMHPNPQEVFTIGMLVAFQMFASRLSQPVLRMVGLWQQLQQARLAVDRLGDLMNAPSEPYSASPSRQALGRGHIELVNVGFQYAPELPPLYQHAHMVIAPGEVAAIMGASGTGKSTLAKLLQGFYRATQGRILIDGIDVQHLSANELRSHFGVVPQETVLFSGTVFDNLSMASPYATFEEIVMACQMAEIHSAIQALPKGYQTVIGERGAGLSGGQRQRLAIARALLKKPKVLIFDEATSALDEATANAFAHTVNSLRGKVSMLFVAHALPTALQVDQVYRVENQQIQKVERP